MTATTKLPFDVYRDVTQLHSNLKTWQPEPRRTLETVNGRLSILYLLERLYHAFVLCQLWLLS